LSNLEELNLEELNLGELNLGELRGTLRNPAEPGRHPYAS
jgi:hypothetical protein